MRFRIRVQRWKEEIRGGLHHGAGRWSFAPDVDARDPGINICFGLDIDYGIKGDCNKKGHKSLVQKLPAER
jgi:hypothetical protein